MALDYDDLVGLLTFYYDQADTNKVAAATKAWQANIDWIGEYDHQALGKIIEAVSILCTAVGGILCTGFWGWNGAEQALPIALDRDKACPFITEAEPADVTMDAILSAMITADFADFQTFVGIVDGYRAALWNEPFNVEYYAALARGFMS